jgi:hypothetical protein
MRVPAGRLVTGTVKTPVLVLLETTALPCGFAEVPQVIPSAVIVPPPFEVIFPPSVAVLVVTDVEVGVVTVGAVTAPCVVNVPSVEYPLAPVLFVA